MPLLTHPPEQSTQLERVSRAWTLNKGAKTAECVVRTYADGFELRLVVGTQQTLTKNCRFREELVRTQQEWRAVLETKGWSSDNARM